METLTSPSYIATLNSSNVAMKASSSLDLSIMSTRISLVFLFFTSFIIARFILGAFKAFKSPLSHLPGPWYAFLTTMHLRYGFATGKIWKLVERSHKQYGPVVRLGPRQVWISDKEAMKQILLKIDLPKVAMYAEISRDRFSPGLFGEMQVSNPEMASKFHVRNS